MQNQIIITCILLTGLLIYACSDPAQEKRQKVKATKIQDEQLLLNPSDHDPYFIESKEVTKTFGPQSITRNILQDRNDDIWLATWEGILRYDGDVFTNFTKKERLRKFHVFSVLEDLAGQLWFGTVGGGVYWYDGKIFTNFTTKDGLLNDRIINLYEDTKGDIWICSEGGLNRYDGETFHPFTTQEGLTNNNVNSIIEDQHGTYWIGTRGEACTFDGTTFSRLTKADGQPFVNVRTIIEDKNGHMWLGGNDGLWRYDGVSFSQYSSDFVGCIYEDRRGNIWTSSAADGNDKENWVLSRFPKGSLPGSSPAQMNPEAGMLFGILEDQDGHIWFGSVKGAGRYDGEEFDFFSEN